MNTNTDLWFHSFRGTPFPVSTLPSGLAGCVDWLGTHLRLAPDTVAPVMLAQLAGVLVENRDVVSASGASVPLPFSVVISTPDEPSLAMASTEINRTLADLQQLKLTAAAKLDARYEKKLLSSPVFNLPEYARPPGGLEPRQAGEARAHALHVARHPLFWLESPGSRELLKGFAASFDRTLLVTFSHKGPLEKLIAPKRDREASRLGELLARVAQGSHIELPGSRKGAPQITQARLGLIATTTKAALHESLTCGREDVATLLSHSVIVDTAVPATLPARSPIRNAGTYWNQLVTALLESRYCREAGMGVHRCFHERLANCNAVR